MFWNDIKELKEELLTLKNSQLRIEKSLSEIKYTQNCEDQTFCVIIEKLDDISDSLSELFKDKRRQESVELAIKTLDKFDDYMKNVDKLNSMINEFKGAVSIARGALNDKKDLMEKFSVFKQMTDTANQIYRSMKHFIDVADSTNNSYFQINSIYKKVCEENEDKPKKPSKKIPVGKD